MKNLLVVDDNKAIRDLLSFALPVFLNDCDIVTAENGARAAEIFDSTIVNAVVTDLSMPVMDGYGLIEHVREGFPWIPVIAMTGDTDPGVHGRLRRLGVIRCFEKPFDLQGMVQEIRTALGLAESARILAYAAAREVA